MTRFSSFCVSLSIIVVGALIQIAFQVFFGFSYAFVLMTTIVFAFNKKFPEFFFLSLFALLSLDWQPGIGYDTYVLFGIMLETFIVRTFFRFDSLAATVLLSSCGALLFYVFERGMVSLDAIEFVLISTLYALVLFVFQRELVRESV